MDGGVLVHHEYFAGVARGGGELQVNSVLSIWGEIHPKKNQKEAPRMDKESAGQGRERGRLCLPWLTENGGGCGKLRRAKRRPGGMK